MRIAEHVEVLKRDGVALAAAAQRAGLDAAVPTCPGWRIRDLLAHVGGVHRWAASFLRSGRPNPYPPEEEAGFFPVVADDALLDWFRTGHRALVDTIEAADPALTCWSFLPAPAPLAFWARRQAHETAIHRADAEAATATTPDWPPAFAADGIDELLRGFFGRSRSRLVADPPVTMAVATTDVDAAWTIDIGPQRRRVTTGRHPADLTVAGPARDLYLLLWNRAGTDGLELHGDPAVLQLWRSLATVTWG